VRVLLSVGSGLDGLVAGDIGLRRSIAESSMLA